LSQESHVRKGKFFNLPHLINGYFGKLVSW
jgi:hypothetical protein